MVSFCKTINTYNKVEKAHFLVSSVIFSESQVAAYYCNSNRLSVIILQADKFLKCDWLRPVVFKPNLKYLHVKIMPVT